MSPKLVLIVTNSDENNVVNVENHLNDMGQGFLRLNVDEVLKSNPVMFLSNVFDLEETLFLKEKTFKCRDIKSVWFRRPRKITVSDPSTNMEERFVEDEFSASLWSMYTTLSGALWMNNPLYGCYLLEHNKLLQLKIAKTCDLYVPKTIITNCPSGAIRFCKSLGGSLAIKSVHSRIFQKENEISGIYTNKVSCEFLEEHAENIKISPVMFQEYIPKKFELRITIVGTRIFACKIDSQSSERSKIDWRRYDFENVKHEKFNLPENIKNNLLSFMSRCKIIYGAIDMIVDDQGRFVFLEVNPNGQYGWIEGLTEMPISKAIAETLTRGS